MSLLHPRVRIKNGMWKGAEGRLTGKMEGNDMHEVKVTFEQYGLVSIWIGMIDIETIGENNIKIKRSLFAKKPVSLPAKPKEPEIRTKGEGREFPKEIKVTAWLMEKANNVFTNEKGEYFLHDGYNHFEYIGRLPNDSQHANIGVIVKEAPDVTT